MFMICKDVDGVVGERCGGVGIKKDLRRQSCFSRSGLPSSHHRSYRCQHCQYNNDHNYHCHCLRKNFNGTPIASAASLGRGQQVFPSCSNSLSLHRFWPIAQQDLTRKQETETCSTMMKRTLRDTSMMTTTTLWTMSGFKMSRLIHQPFQLN